MSHRETERPPCARLSAGRALPAPTRVPSSAHVLTEAIPVSAPRWVSARHSRVKERGLRSAEASQDADPGGRALASPCSLHALTAGAATASRRRSTHGAHRRAPGPLRPRHGFQGLAVRATLAWACPDSWPFLSVLSEGPFLHCCRGPALRLHDSESPSCLSDPTPPSQAGQEASTRWSPCLPE